MKKMSLIILSLIAASILIFTGCSTPTPTPTPSPAPAPAPAPAPEKPIVLRYSTQDPNTETILRFVDPWIAEIEKATNGRVKIEPYYSQTLAKGPDTWQAVKTGVADMGFCFH